jgi:hypothetical protein
VRCSTSGNVCGTELNFTASGADASHPFEIGEPPFLVGQPLGGGAFAGFPVPFVANLSVAPGTALCSGDAACAGLVGAPEPPTWAMMLLGFAGLGFAALRRTTKSLRVPATA